MLTTPHAAPILDGTGLVDEVILFDKHAFGSLRTLANPSNWGALQAFRQRLASLRVDAVMVAHHLSSAGGLERIKLLLKAIGARTTVGLWSLAARGSFKLFTEQVYDFGLAPNIKPSIGWR